MFRNIACALLVCHLASSFAAAEQLLSRNAQYRVRCEVYLYVGQIAPGTNERSTEPISVADSRAERGMVFSPLVERTDEGDFLIDGKVETRVYTWVWPPQAKRITVEMTLPGRSRIERVRVQFPSEVQMRPENVRLYVKDHNGNWAYVGEQKSSPSGTDPGEQRKPEVSFQLTNVSGRELRFYIGGDLA